MQSNASRHIDLEPDWIGWLRNPLALIGASRQLRNMDRVVCWVSQRIWKIVPIIPVEWVECIDEFNPSTVHPEHLNYFWFEWSTEPSEIEWFASYDFKKLRFSFSDDKVYTLWTKVIGASSILHLKEVRDDIIIRPTGKTAGKYVFGEQDFNGNLENIERWVFVLRRRKKWETILQGSGEKPFEQPLFTEAFLCGNIWNRKPSFTLGVDTSKVYRNQTRSVYNRTILVTSDDFEQALVDSGEQFWDNWNKDRFAVLQEYIVEQIAPDAEYTFPIHLSRESNVPLSAWVTAIKSFGVAGKNGKGNKIITYTLHGYKWKRGQQEPYKKYAPDDDTLVVTCTIFQLDKLSEAWNENHIEYLIKQWETQIASILGGRWRKMYSEDGF